MCLTLSHTPPPFVAPCPLKALIINDSPPYIPLFYQNISQRRNGISNTRKKRVFRNKTLKNTPYRNTQAIAYRTAALNWSDSKASNPDTRTCSATSLACKTSNKAEAISFHSRKVNTSLIGRALLTSGQENTVPLPSTRLFRCLLSLGRVHRKHFIQAGEL